MAPYDVTVVGAGLAGLQCARLLGRLGLRTLLADKKGDVGVGVQTTGIFVRKTLEDFPLPDSCLGPSVRDVVLHSPSGRSVRLSSLRDEFRLGCMGELYQRFLDNALLADVEWAPCHRFVELETAGCRLHLHFETPTGSRLVETRFLIGADGVLSPVAAALGLSRNRVWIVAMEEIFRLERSTPEEPVLHCFVDPSVAPGYIAWFIEDSATGMNIGVGGCGDRFQAPKALELFKARVAEMFRRRCQVPLERRAGRIPVGGVLPRLVNRHGLLVGDAAGAASPLTAGGLDACLRLSEFAAVITDNYLRDGLGKESVLAQYCGRRFSRRFISRRFMRRAFTKLNHPQLIECGFSLLGWAPFRALAHHVFFGRGSFPEPSPAMRAQRAELRSAGV